MNVVVSRLAFFENMYCLLNSTGSFLVVFVVVASGDTRWVMWVSKDTLSLE